MLTELWNILSETTEGLDSVGTLTLSPVRSITWFLIIFFSFIWALEVNFFGTKLSALISSNIDSLIRGSIVNSSVKENQTSITYSSHILE